MEWVEQDLDEGVSVVTVELVLAVLPAAILTNMWAPFWVVEEQIGRSSKVLLPMRVVTFRPVVDGRVANWAE